MAENNTEDMIINQMVNENMGFNLFSELSPKERAQAAGEAFKYFVEKYNNRDTSKYGRLSFEHYVQGLTPGEGFITEISRGDESSIAKIWYDIFGEDTEMMKQAALQFGKQIADARAQAPMGERAAPMGERGPMERAAPMEKRGR